jgi:alpha-tubulin suppressor-like RCC1 family protein
MGGVGDTRRPVPVAGIVGAAKVAAGAGHSCICAGDGAIWCWGRNGFGELGLGTIRAEVYPPQPAVGVTGMRDVFVGAYHTCSIAGFGSLTCWGRGDHGTIGNGTWVARQATPTAIDLGMMVTVTSAAAGMHHTCVLEFSRVECWGDNAVGQLGVTNQVWRAEPARALPDWATAVGVGYFHSCAAVADFMNPTRDGLYCWGNNSYGQLGVPASPDILGPQRVGGMTARIIAGGYGHTCVLVEGSGAPQCWGANTYGQLGDGTLESRHTPVAVTGLTNAVDVALGRDFSCALLADHTVRCWGSNDRGQLGDGTTVRRSATPVEPVGL